MGVLGMPSTLRFEVKIDGGRNKGGHGTKGGRSPLYAHFTLTVPPGWHQDDTSLLYPLVVKM